VSLVARAVVFVIAGEASTSRTGLRLGRCATLLALLLRGRARHGHLQEAAVNQLLATQRRTMPCQFGIDDIPGGEGPYKHKSADVYSIVQATTRTWPEATGADTSADNAERLERFSCLDEHGVGRISTPPSSRRRSNRQ